MRGEFISTAKDILIHLDNDSFPIFSDNELNRMGGFELYSNDYGYFGRRWLFCW